MWITTWHTPGNPSPSLLAFDPASNAATAAPLEKADGSLLDPENMLNAVAGSAGGAYAVGDGGTILRFHPEVPSWRFVPSAVSPSVSLNALFVTGSGAAIAVGDSNTVVKIEGDTVTPLPSPGAPANTAWFAVTGQSVDHFFVAGAHARLWEFNAADGGTWSSAPLNALGAPQTGQQYVVKSALSVAEGELWLGQEDGHLLHRLPSGQLRWVPSGMNVIPGIGSDSAITALLVRGNRLFVAGQWGALTSVPLR